MDEVGFEVMRDPLLRPAREQDVGVHLLTRRRQYGDAEILVFENHAAPAQLREHDLGGPKGGDTLDRTECDLLDVRHGSPLPIRAGMLVTMLSRIASVASSAQCSSKVWRPSGQ